MTTEKKKAKTSRPTKFTPAMKARICREVSLGKSLRTVLKQKGMPSMSRVMEVLQEDEAWAEHYARSRKAGIELHIDGMIDLADEATAENAHAIRVRVDTRKWIASKLVPKIYGDKIQAEVTTPDAPPLDREALILETGRRMAFLLQAAGNAAVARRLLPAPAAEQPSAELQGAAEAPRPATHNPTPDHVQEEQRTERIVDHGARLSEAADASASMAPSVIPLPIAANRYRKPWNRS